MSCTNCYNGCVEILADKCVKYTGSDNAELLISSGDSLYVIEQILIDKVVSFLDGTGINIIIPDDNYCPVITSFLPVGVVPNAQQLFNAIVQGLCYVHGQTSANTENITAINAAYTMGCVEGSGTDGVHSVVQSVIDSLCLTKTDLEALILDVDTNYVKLSQLNSLIASYQNSLAGLLTKNYTTAQRDAIAAPVAGLIIFNTTTSKLNVYTGYAWETITSA